MDKSKQKNAEITAALAMAPEVAPRFELMSGIHPDEERHLSEEEELYPLELLRHVSNRESLSTYIPPWFLPPNVGQLALLWLKFFPDIDKHFPKRGQDLYESLWRDILEDTEVLNLAYAFYPWDFGGDWVRRHKEVESAAQRTQEMIEQQLDADLRARGKVTWIVPFPADGPLGRVIEEKVGLSSVLKQGVGLNSYPAGLLCNFLLSRKLPLERLLDPHQFEDLAGAIFREEGWTVTRMPKTRDGGKDVIARRVVDGIPRFVYIQATTEKVGVGKVKEFVATVAGDKADQGIIVTTSCFSRDSAEWLRTKGISLANVELMDRVQLEARMQKIADGGSAVFSL